MFGIGMSEMLIICAVALLVFGPNELPQIAKKIARGVRDVRKASDDLRKSIDLDDDEPPPTRRPPPPALAYDEHSDRNDRELAPAITGSVLTEQTLAASDVERPAEISTPITIASSAGTPDAPDNNDGVPVLQSAAPLARGRFDDDDDDDDDDRSSSDSLPVTAAAVPAATTTEPHRG